MGHTTTTTETVMLTSPTHIFQRKKGAAYANSGELNIYLELKPHYSFLDYIQGGTDLACTIAIDFTGA